MDYTWEAIYNDGTTLPQYNEKGEKNGYENIDKSKLKAFAINYPDPEDNKKKKLFYRLHLEPGQKLVYVRRGFIDFSTSSKQVTDKRYFLMVGWQKNINGENIQSISYIYDDGHIEHAGVWAGGEPTPKSII